jgi:2-iminobutanoate/2-iminopropanoate deaminase
MLKQILSTSEAPDAVGPYSQAVRAGNTVYVSGQLPIDPATGAFAGQDIASQSRQSLENVRAILASAGGGLESVVKMTVFLKSMEDFEMMNKVYAEYFPSDCPARSAVEVGCLPKGARVEMEAVAVL